MRLFGREAETDIQRERREKAEAEHRVNRDAAVNARRAADDIEVERKKEWQRVQEQGQAQMRRHLPAKMDQSPEAVAARTAAAKQAGESEAERRRSHRAVRDQAVQQAVGARASRQSALDSGDIEAFVHAHGRLLALDEFVHQLDAAERTRQTMAAMPTMHGAARL
jgi:hypothetical protein